MSDAKHTPKLVQDGPVLRDQLTGLTVARFSDEYERLIPEFILMANSHAALVEACKAAAHVWEQGCVDRGWNDGHNWIDEAKDKIDAALSLAAQAGEER